MISLTLAKCVRSVRKTLSFTTLASEPPAARAIALRLSNTRRISASMSPLTSAPLTGSSGICPDTYTVSPTRTACEYGPMALGASAVWMICRFMGSLAAVARGPVTVAGYGPHHPQHIGHAAHHAHDTRQLHAVGHLDDEDDDLRFGIALLDRNVVDVGLGAGDGGRQCRQHAHAVDDVDADFRQEQPSGFVLPGYRQPLFRLLAIILDVGTGLAVHDDAAAGAQTSEDRVVGNRVAAMRIADQQSLGAGHRQRRGSARDCIDALNGQ